MYRYSVFSMSPYLLWLCMCMLLMGIGPEYKETNRPHNIQPYANNNNFKHTQHNYPVGNNRSICWAIRNVNPLNQTQTNQDPLRRAAHPTPESKTALRHKPTFGRSLMWKFALDYTRIHPYSMRFPYWPHICAHPHSAPAITSFPAFGSLYFPHLCECISGLKREHTCDADSIRKIVSSQLFGGVWRGRGGRANTHSVAVVSRPWLVPTLPLLLRFRDRQTTAVCPVDMFVCVCGHCVSHWCHWQRNVHIIRAYIRVGGGHHSTFEHEKKILVLHTADGLFVRWGRWSSVEPQNDVFWILHVGKMGERGKAFQFQ